MVRNVMKVRMLAVPVVVIGMTIMLIQMMIVVIAVCLRKA